MHWERRFMLDCGVSIFSDDRERSARESREGRIVFVTARLPRSSEQIRHTGVWEPPHRIAYNICPGFA